ncbi:unnamed protein product, partial [Nesidiocoris tenuis]
MAAEDVFVVSEVQNGASTRRRRRKRPLVRRRCTLPESLPSSPTIRSTEKATFDEKPKFLNFWQKTNFSELLAKNSFSDLSDSKKL